VWYSPLCSECSMSIALGEGSRYKFRTILESSLNLVWLAWFMNCFLWFIIIFFFAATSWSKLSKGGVSSFFCLCCKVSPPCKANVEEGQLCFILGNAFAFAWYSKMFPPFARYSPMLCFVMVGITSRWENSFRNPPLFHTLSFDAHRSSFLSSSCIYNKHRKNPSCPLGYDYNILEEIIAIPHECMSPQTLFYLSSHFLLWSLILLHDVRSPCSLLFITSIQELNSIMLLDKQKSSTHLVAQTLQQ